jgi:hypothetical protein
MPSPKWWPGMGDDLPDIYDSMNEDELRREAKHLRDLHYGLLTALRKLPAAPSPYVLRTLGSVARFPADHDAGKAFQRQHRGTVPFVSECEGGMGVWLKIRESLLIKNTAGTSDAASDASDAG